MGLKVRRISRWCWAPRSKKQPAAEPEGIMPPCVA
jgi:hypothetical protein